jgi:hypothetical protein
MDMFFVSTLNYGKLFNIADGNVSKLVAESCTCYRIG